MVNNAKRSENIDNYIEINISINLIHKYCDSNASYYLNDYILKYPISTTSCIEIKLYHYPLGSITVLGTDPPFFAVNLIYLY